MLYNIHRESFGGDYLNVKIKPDVLDSIRESLREKGKDAVRFDIVGFG